MFKIRICDYIFMECNPCGQCFCHLTVRSRAYKAGNIYFRVYDIVAVEAYQPTLFVPHRHCLEAKIGSWLTIFLTEKRKVKASYMKEMLEQKVSSAQKCVCVCVCGFGTRFNCNMQCVQEHIDKLNVQVWATGKSNRIIIHFDFIPYH